MARWRDWEVTGYSRNNEPCNSYRELIRGVAGPDWHVNSGSTLFFQSGHSVSSFSSNSGATSSYLSSNSAISLRSVTRSHASNYCAIEELRGIAWRMVNDGYTQRMVQAFGMASSVSTFGYRSGQDRALEEWFFELDVDWVLQSRYKLGNIRYNSSWLQVQDLVERWLRALTVIPASIQELLTGYDHFSREKPSSDIHETLAVARFCKVSISSMLVFVDTVVHVLKAEKIQALLHMYNCVSSASYYMCTMTLIYPEAQSIFNDIGRSLDTEGNKLTQDIFNTMMHVRQTFMKEEESWVLEIPQEGGDVHTNIRFLVDCILWIRQSLDSTKNIAQSHNTIRLRDLVDGMIVYTKDLLVRKSELCPNPSLRYLFLFNNSNFVARVSETGPSIELIPECEEYMNSYLEVTWGHVMSCISESNLRGPLGRWINHSPLTKFVSAFHETWTVQKSWKVPDPRLRSILRNTITERVISSYDEYLKKHPELAEQVRSGSNSPYDLEEKLRGLFES